MELTTRPLRMADLPTVARLFHDTVHTVAAGDYTPAQLAAWSPDPPNPNRWHHFVERDIGFVAELPDFSGTVVGFGVLTRDGYIDMLYTHRGFQGRGIASALLARLEKAALDLGLNGVELQSSITARTFYEHHGYSCVGTVIVERSGVRFENFVMRKKLT